MHSNSVCGTLSPDPRERLAAMYLSNMCVGSLDDFTNEVNQNSTKSSNAHVSSALMSAMMPFTNTITSPRGILSCTSTPNIQHMRNHWDAHISPLIKPSNFDLGNRDSVGCYLGDSNHQVYEDSSPSTLHL